MIGRVLLIEDDKDISQTLSIHLREADMDVTAAYDGVQGIDAFEQGGFSCVLLDLMLPKKNGIEVLGHIRKISRIPVIIISAKDTEFDITVALDLGADDYVTKPFSFGELTARIKSSIRRSTLYSEVGLSSKLSYGCLRMDLETHTVTINQEYIKLTNTEFEILKLFLNNQTRVFTKEDVYKAVWEEDYYGDENIVNVHMSRLREKIESDPKNPEYIQTLWGIGYRMKTKEGNV